MNKIYCEIAKQRTNPKLVKEMKDECTKPI